MLTRGSSMLVTRALGRSARAQARYFSIASLEGKVTSDEAKQELNRLKMALGACPASDAPAPAARGPWLGGRAAGGPLARPAGPGRAP